MSNEILQQSYAKTKIQKSLIHTAQHYLMTMGVQKREEGERKEVV